MLKVALISLPGEALQQAPVFLHNVLAVTTLAGYLRERFSVAELALRVEELAATSLAELADQLERWKPDLIGVSMRTDSLAEVRELEAELAVRPGLRDVPLVLGGIAPSVIHQDLSDIFPRALLVRGEGEQPLEALVRWRMGRGALRDVPGLLWRDPEGRVVSNRARPFFLDRERYQPADDLVAGRIRSRGEVWIESSRGCRASCSFCSKGCAHTGSPGHRRFPLARTIERMRRLHEQMGVRRFRFSDEDFFDDDLEFVERFCAEVSTIGDAVLFEIDCRASDIVSASDTPQRAAERQKRWRALSDAGLAHVFVGVESLSDSQLVRYRKGVDARQIRTAIEHLRALGMSFSAGFIPFDPFATLEELEETLGQLLSTDLVEEINTPIKTLRLQRGTALATTAQHAGLVTGLSADRMSYRYRYESDATARVAAVAKRAEAFKGAFLDLNLLIRTGAAVEDELAEGALRALRGQNSDLKRTQTDFLLALIDATRRGRDPEPLWEDFRARCRAAFRQVEEVVADTRAGSARTALETICGDFLRDIGP